MTTERLDDLVTEGRRPKTPDYETASTLELVQSMNAEDATVAQIVGEAGPELAALIDGIVERLGRGGRLVYVGAGTSGRLAALDAAECEPTFSTEPGQVVALEFIAGSTRLKAGTAQKLVLNTISTVSMVRLGKTFGDLMVDVSGTNEKLRARARRTVVQATGAAPDDVDAALEAAGGDAKVAIVSLLAGNDADSARARLNEA